MSTEERPVSPHLTIYRWPISMTLSILHRMTGVALSAGLVVWVFWLEAIAYEAVSYDTVKMLMDTLIGQFVLLGLSFCFFFHLSNGVRHLIWDTGRLFEKSQAEKSAWAVIIAAVVLTAGYWIIIQG